MHESQANEPLLEAGRSFRATHSLVYDVGGNQINIHNSLIFVIDLTITVYQTQPLSTSLAGMGSFATGLGLDLCKYESYSLMMTTSSKLINS
jgi:hypothetical protein